MAEQQLDGRSSLSPTRTHPGMHMAGPYSQNTTHHMSKPHSGQYPDDDASLEAALDELLDDPDFLEGVADRLLYEVRLCLYSCHTNGR